ncbi:transposable element Tcb2 transposase [Trichonephila clavipes]|nr:transposable element Tcb2 transposase [Trichonephila clavipes]
MSVHHVVAFIRALKVLTRVDSCCFKSKFYRKDLIDELKIFGMSSRHHIDDFMRGRIIGKIEEGRKITDVAREFDIAHSVASRLWKSFKTTGMCSRRHGGGRVRSTTPAEDRYIVLSAKRNRRTTAQQVANQFLAASGKQISRKTVARRLRGGGLYARRSIVCVPLTRQHRTAHLQWCREHHNWTEQDWACVLFSDESRFSLSSDCRRQLIWRESGTAYRPENIQEKDRYPTCSIMVWAGIMINGRTRLHVVANGTMTGQRYIDEVLLPHVRLFRGADGDKFFFMEDNATCHRTLAVQDCLDSEGIQRLVWPARSPYLNPIENVWDALGRQVAGRNYPPTNKNTLIRALTEEWDKLPQQLLDNVVQSMCNSQVLSLFGCGIQVASLLLIGPAPFFDMAPTVWIVVLSLVLMGFALGAKLVCAFTGTLQDTMNRGLPPDLSTYGLVSSMIASSQSLGAFVGPSLGGYFLDEFGFRKASMTLLILETVLIILLVVSLCTSNICTKKADTIKYEIKKQVPNGCLPKEENIENSCLKTISN